MNPPLPLQANNLVLHTAVEHFRKNRGAVEHGGGHQNGCTGLPHIITSNVEHDSIRLTAKHLQTVGKAGGRDHILPGMCVFFPVFFCVI